MHNVFSSKSIICSLIFLIVCVFILGSATSIEQGFSEKLTFTFFEPIIERDVFDHIRMDELNSYGKPGEPMLPYRTVKILLPFEEEFERLSVVGNEKIYLDDRFVIAPGQKAYPLIINNTEKTLPNETIYNSEDPFPGILYSIISIQEFRGYRILSAKIYPVHYIPLTGDVFYFKSMDVYLYTKSKNDQNVLATKNIKDNFRGLEKDEKTVKKSIDNPSMLSSYEESKYMEPLSIVNSSKSYDYVIITNSSLNSSFQRLLEGKVQKGLNVTTVLVEDIIADPDYWCNGTYGDGCNGSLFNDTQAMIRNFIKDAYLNWGIEYVLLGGDDNIVPIRGVYAYSSGYTDTSLPSDLYYGALNGSWNYDNDSYWAEPGDGPGGGEIDLYAEVYVGRVPADTTTEVERFVNKTLYYEQHANDDYIHKALMVGEELDSITYGGDAKDRIAQILWKFSITRLYEQDNLFSEENVRNEINNNTHIINHNGHAQYYTVIDFSQTEIGQLDNTKPCFIYTIGCYTAAFDSATSGSTGSVAENAVIAENTSFAFIGNTRYGWYLPGSDRYVSNDFDYEFFDAVFNENITNLGKALDDSRVDLIGEVETSGDMTYRWIYLELVLFGDPETAMYTNFTAPIANISYPISKGNDVFDIIEINGTAKKGESPNASNFENYTLEYGSDNNPTNWSSSGIALESNGNSSVNSNLLATWDTTIVNDGSYTLRLIVTNSNDTIAEDRIFVTINNLEIVSPTNFSFHGIKNLSIIGTANGTNFQGYNIKYGEGTTPTNWSSNGIELMSNGTVGIKDGLLGTLNTSYLTTNNYYILKLEINNSLEQNYTLNKTIVFYSDLQQGWPHNTTYRLTTYGPGVADLDGNGIIEIIIGEAYGSPGDVKSQNRSTYAWHFNGTMVPGWPIAERGNIYSAPAIGNLDDDDEMEVVMSAYGYSVSNVHSFDFNGDSSSCSSDYVVSSANLAHMGGDEGANPLIDIIIGDRDSRLYVNNRYCWDVHSAWPKNVGSDITSTAAIADIDNDSYPEIFFSTTNGSFHVLYRNGSYVPDWPISLSAYNTVGSPVIGDLDNDGDLEIVIGIGGKVHVLNTDASNHTGWSKSVSGTGTFVSTSPSLADLDGDGKLEIIYEADADIKLYVWYQNGTNFPGWPITIDSKVSGNDGENRGQPIIGDIDGDGDQEILVVTDRRHDKIFAYHHDGSNVSGWPRVKPTSSVTSPTLQSSPVLADIDKDGDIELLLGIENYMLIWDLNATYNPQNIEWGMFQHDIRRTGYYRNPNLFPIATKFSGKTTEFIFENNMTEVFNAILENVTFGKIEFGNQAINFTGFDLNSNVNITNASVYINTTAIPNLNVSAKISLYNLGFTSPKILKDGEDCPSTICNITNYYPNGTVVFTVTHFSNYTAVENADVNPPTVILINPENDSVWNSSFTVLFEYNVTDNVNVSNCSLIINNALNQTDNNITINITQNFTLNLSNAYYNWSINCTDNSSNTGSSDIYYLNVSVNTIPEVQNITLNSDDSQNRTNGNLTGTYDFYDIDNQSETNNQTKWYRNGTEVAELENLTYVSSSNTSKNDTWSFSVRVFDGINWSSWYNSSNLTIENTIPQIVSKYPNSSNVNISEPNNQTFNVTKSDTDNDQLNVSWYKNNSLVLNGINEDEWNFTGNYSITGIYNITVVVSDNESSVSYEWTLNISNTNRLPSVPNLTNPENNSNVSTSNVTFVYNSSDQDGDELNYYLFIDSILNLTTNQTTSYVLLPEGIHNWSVKAGDSEDNSSIASYMYFTVDITPPSLNITSPENASYYNSSFVLDIDVSDEISSIDTVWYNINNTNSSLNASYYNVTINISNLNEGLNVIKAYANDTAGNVRTDSITVYKDTIIPGINQTSPSSDATGISISTNITVVFNETVNTSSAENAFNISPCVNGTFYWNTSNNTLTFDPNSSLSYSTTYNITINSTTKDLVGNNLEFYSWVFTTESESQPDTPPSGGSPSIGPAITTTPEEEEEEIPETMSKKEIITLAETLKENENLKSALGIVLEKIEMDLETVENIIKTSETVTSYVEASRSISSASSGSSATTSIMYKGKETAKNFIIYDIIPKSFANSSDLITVSAPGANYEIVEKDPEYVFVYPEVSENQEINITYTVGTEINTTTLDDFRTEIYAEDIENITEEKNETEKTSGRPDDTKQAKEMSKKDDTDWIWLLLLIIVISAIIILIISKKYTKILHIKK